MKITEAMIEAGRAAYAQAMFIPIGDGPYSLTPEEHQTRILKAVYSEMARASFAPIETRSDETA